MRSIIQTLSGLATLAAATAAQAHPGHSTQLVHSHDSVTLGIAAFMVAAVMIGGALIYGSAKRRQQNPRVAAADVKVKTRKRS